MARAGGLTAAYKQYSTNVGFAWGDRLQGLNNISIKDRYTDTDVFSIVPIPMGGRTTENYPFNCGTLLDSSYTGWWVNLTIHSEQTNASTGYYGFTINTVKILRDTNGYPTGSALIDTPYPGVVYVSERFAMPASSVQWWTNTVSIPLTANAFCMVYNGSSTDTTAYSRRLNYNSVTVSLSPTQAVGF